MKPPILIAESDAKLCEMYGRFLMDHGYKVESSSDGLNCLSRLRQRMPAALVLDLDLLWGGGAGVLDWIREQAPMRGIPVILTANAGYSGDFEGFTEPPVVDVLRKHFALPVLLEAVRCAVARPQSTEIKIRRGHSELFIG